MFQVRRGRVLRCTVLAASTAVLTSFVVAPAAQADVPTTTAAEPSSTDAAPAAPTPTSVTPTGPQATPSTVSPDPAPAPATPTEVAPAPGDVSNGDTVVGELVQAWPDPTAEEHTHEDAEGHHDEAPLSWIEPAEGDAVRVPTDSLPDVTVGSTLAVTVGDEVVDEASAEQGFEPAVEVQAATVLDAATPDPSTASAGTAPTNTVTAVLVLPAGATADGMTIGTVLNTLNGAVSSFWDEQSNGSIRIAAVQGAAGWVRSSQPCSKPSALWNDVATQIHWTGGAGKHLMLYVPSTASGCSYGLGTVETSVGSGGRSYVRAAALSVMAHELGHNFGLGHSSELQCPSSMESGACQVRSYYDFYDVMGISWAQVGSLNAVQAARLGLLPSAEQIALTSSSATTTVRLAPASASSGIRAVKLTTRDGAVYYLEYRQASGRDGWLGDYRNAYRLDPGVLLRRASDEGDTSILIDGSPSPQPAWSSDLQQALPAGVSRDVAGEQFSVTVQTVGTTATVVVRPNARVLVRTPESAAVYVVSGSSKFRVADMGMLAALSPLGSVGFVSQQYLDGLTTGPQMSRIVTAPSGEVYFIDAGIRLPFSSCGRVADFGGSCSSLVRWDQSLIDAFVPGPVMSPLYRTTSGKAFWVSGGAKREVVDDQALLEAGLPTAGVRLLETGLANLPYGVPVTRDGVAVQVRGAGGAVVASGGGFTQVTEGVRAGSSLSSLPVRALDAASVARLAGVVSVPGALVAGPGASGVFLLTDAGKRQVVDPAAAPGSAVRVSASFLGLFQDGTALPVGSFVKGAQSSAVYAWENGVRRKVASWADLVAFAGSANPVVVTVDQRIADALPLGAARLPLGALVHSPRSGAVFFVNGTSELIPLGSFAVSGELGAIRLVAVSDRDVEGYAVRASVLGTAVDCSGTRFLGLGGRLYAVGTDVADAYRLSYTVLDPTACATLPKAGAPLTQFLRSPSGTIYQVLNGTKRPLTSYPGYVAAGGTPANTLQLSDFALSRIPSGAPR